MVSRAWNVVRESLKRARSSPLAQFAIGAALIFGVDAARKPDSIAERKTIHLSSDFVAGMRARACEGARPEECGAQVELAIADFVREEALFREAAALGLERGDTIVRRRLVEKMRFALESRLETRAPTDDELSTFAARYAARYALPERRTWSHVFVPRGDDASEARAQAEALLRALGAGADPATLGFPFARGSRFVDESTSDVGGVFGSAFADALFHVSIEQWSGPIESAFGFHLVHVEDTKPATLPTVASLRDRLVADWSEEATEEALRAAERRVAAEYLVVREETSTP